MLTSISPLGERARGNRFGTTATAHIAGSVIGGALGGAAAGTVGALILDPLDSHSATVAGLALVASAIAAGLLLDRRGLPTVRRQVDERWIGTYRGWAYGAGYGVQLGMGVVTIVPSSLTYVTFVAAAATGATAAGTVVGAAFGLTRGLSVLLSARVRSTAELAGLHRRVVAAGRPVARATAGAAWVVGVAALAAAVGLGA